MTDLLASGHVVFVAGVLLDVRSLRKIASLIEALVATPFLCFCLDLLLACMSLDL